jgi:hypothetical protein
MASLKDATNTSLAGYEAVPAAPFTRPSPPTVDLQPGFSPHMRSPYPILGASPDGLRQFYQGTIPQNRLLPILPIQDAGVLTQKGVVITTIGSGTGSGSSSGGTGGGTSGGGTSTVTAQSTSLTTPSLGPGARFVSALNISKSFQPLLISSTVAARLELYGTATTQAGDAGRGLDVAPPAGTTQNIITDVALDTAPFQWSYQDQVGANADNPQVPLAYLTVTNLSAGSAAITVTLLYVPLESI